MNSTRAVRVRLLASIVVAITIASAGLLGGAAPALAKAKARHRVYTFYVDSRGGVMYYHRAKSCRYLADTRMRFGTGRWMSCRPARTISSTRRAVTTTSAAT